MIRQQQPRTLNSITPDSRIRVGLYLQGGPYTAPPNAQQHVVGTQVPHVAVIPQSMMGITPSLALPPSEVAIMLGQVTALVMLSLTGIIISTGEVGAICCLPLGLLLCLPGALYAKQKKSDYFMIVGLNPPTSPFTWVALVVCVLIWLASLIIPFL